MAEFGVPDELTHTGRRGLIAAGSVGFWRETRRYIGKQAFKVARVKRSHRVMSHLDGRGTIVPVHQGRDVAKGTLRGILRDVGLTVEELDAAKRDDTQDA